LLRTTPIAQRDAFGKTRHKRLAARRSALLPARVGSPRRWSGGLPTPLGANFSMSGFPTMAWQEERRKGWYFSASTSQPHHSLLGPVNGDVRLSMDGCLHFGRNVPSYSGGLSNLANGFVEWTGTSSYFQKSAARDLP